MRPVGRVISRIASRPPGRSTRRSSCSPCSSSDEVADAEADRRRVERLVRERKRERVAFDPLELGSLAARALEHRLREVEPRDLSARCRRRDREVAGSAAGVEHPVAGPDHRFGRLAAPAPVEPGRHQPVHRVVDGRDPVEHRPHALGRKRPALDAHAGLPSIRDTSGARRLTWLVWTRLIRRPTA